MNDASDVRAPREFFACRTRTNILKSFDSVGRPCQNVFQLSVGTVTTQKNSIDIKYDMQLVNAVPESLLTFASFVS